MKRRAVLGGAASSLFAISGCLSGLGFDSEPSGVLLTRLSINNLSNSSHTVAVEVLYDGDVGLSREYEAGPMEGNRAGGQVIDVDPPDGRSDVVVRAEMGDQSEEIDLTVDSDVACVDVSIRIESWGDLAFWTHGEGPECLDRTPTPTDRPW